MLRSWKFWKRRSWIFYIRLRNPGDEVITHSKFCTNMEWTTKKRFPMHFHKSPINSAQLECKICIKAYFHNLCRDFATFWSWEKRMACSHRRPYLEDNSGSKFSHSFTTAWWRICNWTGLPSLFYELTTQQINIVLLVFLAVVYFAVRKLFSSLQMLAHTSALKTTPKH